MARLGFKVRPLRDGGGKPSPGRSPPPLRKPVPSLVELGKKILGLANNVVDKVLESIHRQDKHHPFPPDLLVQVRSLVPGSHRAFFLDHLRTMAEMANDPDSQYFEVLKNGVPLGVKEPPLKSPGIWPTKEELKGESPSDGALEDPRGRGNYASAELHAEDIQKTFLEERDLDMVIGPLPPRKRRPSVDVTYQNYAQALWQPLMKETRFEPSMMAPGEEPMHTSRFIQKNALRPPQSWTVFTASTGCKRHRRSRDTRSSPTHTGIGPNRMTSGCF